MQGEKLETEKMSAIIEQLASEVIIINPNDLQSMGKIINLFDELTTFICPEKSDCRELVRDSIEILNRIILSESDDQNGDMVRVCEKTKEIQNHFNLMMSEYHSNDAVSNLNDKQTDNSASNNPKPYEMPEWVEDKTFRDFLSNQVSVLEDIETDILGLENGKAENMAALRRRVHTLKGESGVLGLDDLSEVCHKLEDYLDENDTNPKTVDTLLQVKDWIAQAIESYANLHHPSLSAAKIISLLKPPVTEKKREETKNCSSLINFEKRISEAKNTPVVNTVLNFDDETLSMLLEFCEEGEEGVNLVDQILIRLEDEGPSEEHVNCLFRTFHSLKGVAGFLELHEIASLAHKTENLLNVARQSIYSFNGAMLDLVFDSNDIMRALIKEVRQAIDQQRQLNGNDKLPSVLERLEAAVVNPNLPETPLPVVETGTKIGEVLLNPPFNLDPEKLATALERQENTGRRLGEELIEDGSATPKQIAQALRAQKRANISEDQSNSSRIKETVKIDLERVDNLLEMVGELVIVESMIVHSPEVADLRSLKVRNYLNQMTKISRDLQNVTMSMRMVPVRGVFQKMARLVRDLSRKSGKHITLIQSGEGTEMDRSMVEQIGDPLVHMIRNAVDHGIESAKDRKAAGKPAGGTINLSAYHEGGNIVIELADDGQGLNRERILQKALSQGLIKESDNLSEDEIFNLIFKPGFSTAQEVTEISGRGVGMDVVRRNIENMRGRIKITSELGKGTTIRLMLPLTLAIIDGMLVSCGNERYIIPTLSIVESIKPKQSMYFSLAKKHEFINLRSEVLPLCRLCRLFGIYETKHDITDSLVVVVESVNSKIGLLVDDVLTQQQVVIKSLADSVRNSNFFSGAAILSDGRVGLILNVDEIGSSMNKALSEESDNVLADKKVI